MSNVIQLFPVTKTQPKEVDFFANQFVKGDYESVAVIAKKIRAKIKEAIKLDLLPKGTKVSVRSENFAGGSAIRISIKSLGGTIVANPVWVDGYDSVTGNVNGFASWEDGCPSRYTEEASAYLDTIKKIHDIWNYNNSDSQTDYFDVNYYGDVSFDYTLLNKAA